MVTGAAGVGGSGIVEIASGGLASPVALPAAAASAGLFVFGLNTAKNGLNNLLNQNGRVDASSNSSGNTSSSNKTQPTSNSARREAMRQKNIPTSQQPVSQKQTPAGRVYEYIVPKPGGGSIKKQVQQQLKDRDHPPHWEAGATKPGGQKDAIGRDRLQNNKIKVYWKL